MVQIDKDGVTLFYTDANGNRVSATVFDPTNYTKLLQTRGAQVSAVGANALAIANYDTALNNAQASVNAGILVPPPGKPLMTVVADTGEVTYVPFVPPLADLLIPVKAAPVSTPIVTVSSADSNQQAVMYNMILAMFRKEFPDA